MQTTRTTLRALEDLLLRRGQQTARRNAWNAVLEDRRRAEARAETLDVLRAAETRSRTAT